MTRRDQSLSLTVRTNEDLVAFVPIALGFVPADSAVMLTFDSRGTSFHARSDLTGKEDLDELVETLLTPCLRHQVEAVFLICWAPAELAEQLAWRFLDRFVDEGVEVRAVLRVEDGRWYAVLPGHPPHEYEGAPVDLDSHRFTAQAIYAGAVRHRSREDLRASIEADATAVAVRPARPYPSALLGGLVRGAIAESRPPTEEELARIVTSLRNGTRRDAVWAHLDRDGAPDALEWWRGVVRRLTDEDAADACAVVAFVAWLAGDGALAWCAVDRTHRTRPDHSLANLVADLLADACSPDAWAAMRRAMAPDPGLTDAGPAA